MKHPLLSFWSLTTALALLSSAGSATAQVALGNSPYVENFNTLPTSGTNAKSTLPAGWDFNEVGTGANLTYGSDNGSSNGGNTYSYGAASNSDRSLGSLRSGAVASTIGASFTNATTATISSLVINFTGKTWRIGAANRVDRMSFQYSLNATSLADAAATWTSVTALDYANPGGATSTAAVTTPLHQAIISSTLTNLTLEAGKVLWIRWTDEDATGADDGMAIDDFAIGLPGSLAPSPVLSVSPTSLILGNQNLNTSSAAQSFVLSATNTTAAITVTAPAGFTVSKEASTNFGSSLTYTSAELGTAQTVYVRFTPTTTGLVTGLVTVASAGASAKEVAVSGNGLDPSVVLTSFNFDDCVGGGLISQGWMQYSVTGAQTWECTTFGRDPNAPAGTTAFPNAVQINGFANGTNVLNEDWLISPAFNTATYTFPLFSFWSRVAFNGGPLQLRVSTNYSGTGSPTAAGVTWTNLDVAFPAAGSNVWTQTSNVDLSLYKGTAVYVAFVYTATEEEGARWTLDDISLNNSATPPPPVLAASAQSLEFGYLAAGTSATQTLTLTPRNLTDPLTVTATGTGFQLSKDGTTFASSQTYTVAEANNQSQTLAVRFSPTQNQQNYTGTLSLASTGATTATVRLSGNTYNTDNTLEVVNWNVEWFGSTENGPRDKVLQFNNVQTILNALKADIYGLVEIVDTARLGTIVRQFPNRAYRYVVSDFGSYADNAQDPDYANAQKLAFVYKHSIFKNVQVSALFRCTEAQNCPEFNAWSSGRFPYLLDADVTLNGQTQHFTFVLIHAKANTSPTATSYARRLAAANGLKAKLDADYAGKNVVILGDFNDDLDQTITAGITPPVTSYSAFTTDTDNYTALTLPLSLAGLRSTVGYNDIIDHVVVTKAVVPLYLPGSAEILTSAANLVTNYATTTTDHYPVQTRYTFGVTTPTKNAVANRQFDVYPNPVTNTVRLALPPSATNGLRLQVHAVDGRKIVEGAGSLEQLNQQLNQNLNQLKAGMYIIQVTSGTQTYVKRIVKQ